MIKSLDRILRKIMPGWLAVLTVVGGLAWLSFVAEVMTMILTGRGNETFFWPNGHSQSTYKEFALFIISFPLIIAGLIIFLFWWSGRNSEHAPNRE